MEGIIKKTGCCITEAFLKAGRKVKSFWEEEDGMGVVEIVLIIVVLIGLVIIFKSQITTLVNKLLAKMSSQANKI